MKNTLVTLTMACGLSMTAQMNPTKIQYPQTRKDATTDNYFNTPVPDPYRWLEDDRSAETAAWVKAENEVTFNYLDKIPLGMRYGRGLKKYGITNVYRRPLTKAITLTITKITGCKTNA